MSTVDRRLQPTAGQRAATAAVFGALAGVAWIASVSRMDGMEMGGRFSVGSLGFFVVLWILMMAAMMFPSVWPAVAMYGVVVRRRAAAGERVVVRTASFSGAYLLAWGATGVLAFALLALVRAFGVDGLSESELARYVVAPVAFAAAVYQVVPFKQACLRHCRGPLSFFAANWREGWTGALWMGVRHGGYCIGCCWLLMAVLLALGVMSVAWMVVVSVAVAVEKLAPARWGSMASALLVAGLVGIAVVALVRPSWLPGVDPGMGTMEDGGM